MRKPRVFTSVASAAFAVLACCSATAPAGATEDAGQVPAFDFGACPEIPAGADPTAWRCEVMIAVGGHLRLGRIDQKITEPIRITFAEGRIDGETRQVFGEFRAAAMPVGGLRHKHGSGPRLWITPEYAGYSDFLANDERRGEINMKFGLSGPLLPGSCRIGSDQDPARLVLHDSGPMRVISDQPPVRAFGVTDKTFKAPGTRGCGPLGTALNRRLGLPAPSGANELSLDAYYSFRTYDTLPAVPA